MDDSILWFGIGLSCLGAFLMLEMFFRSIGMNRLQRK